MSDQQVTYVMLNARNGYIKIGRSSNPSFREKTLQSEEPEVYLLGICNQVRESDLHKRCAPLRLRGEWFALSGNLLAEILLDFILTEEGRAFIVNTYGCRDIDHLRRSLEWISWDDAPYACDEDLEAVSLE
jgi:hypothetical protein